MRRLLLVLLIGLTTGQAAAAAELVPGTPQFAVSKRGTAVVAPTFAAGVQNFTPFVGRRAFTVFARLPAGQRRPTRVLMKYKPPAKRCAPSFRLDSGRAIGLRTALPNAQGYATFTSPELNWTRAGATRFCVWLTSRPAARVRPIGSVMRFMRDGLGIVQYPDRGSTDVGVVTDIATTVPLHLTKQRLNCTPPSTNERDIQASTLPGFRAYTDFTYQASCPTMTSVATITSSITGTQTLSMDATQAAAGAVRAGGSGLCMLSNVEMSESAARSLLDLQGCRVGTVHRAPKHSVIGSGNVWTHTVNGMPASLVAPGTVVDLVIEP